MFTFPLESLHTHHTSINIKANTSKNQFWGSLSLKRERAPKPEKHNKNTKNTKNTKKHTNKKNINKHKKTQKNTKVGQEGLRVSIDITIGSYVPYDVGIINGRLVNGRLVRRRWFHRSEEGVGTITDRSEAFEPLMLLDWGAKPWDCFGGGSSRMAANISKWASGLWVPRSQSELKTVIITIRNANLDIYRYGDRER